MGASSDLAFLSHCRSVFVGVLRASVLVECRNASKRREFRRNRAIADIAPHLPAGEMNLLGDLISASLRNAHRVAERCNAQHATAARDYLSILEPRSRME